MSSAVTKLTPLTLADCRGALDARVIFPGEVRKVGTAARVPPPFGDEAAHLHKVVAQVQEGEVSHSAAIDLYERVAHYTAAVAGTPRTAVAAAALKASVAAPLTCTTATAVVAVTVPDRSPPESVSTPEGGTNAVSSTSPRGAQQVTSGARAPATAPAKATPTRPKPEDSVDQYLPGTAPLAVRPPVPPILTSAVSDGNEATPAASDGAATCMPPHGLTSLATVLGAAGSYWVCLVPVASVSIPAAEVPTLDEGLIKDLAVTLEVVGQLNPVLLYFDGAGFELLAGRHRRAGSERVGRDTLFALVTTEADPIKRNLMTIIENVNRVHDPARRDEQLLEQHRLYQQLRVAGSTQARAGVTTCDARPSSAPMTSAQRTRLHRAKKRLENVIPDVVEAYKARRIKAVAVDRIAKLPSEQQAAALEDELRRAATEPRRRARARSDESATQSRAVGHADGGPGTGPAKCIGLLITAAAQVLGEAIPAIMKLPAADRASLVEGYLVRDALEMIFEVATQLRAATE